MRTELVSAVRAHETAALDAEIRAAFLRRESAAVDLDRVVRAHDVGLSFGGGRYMARVRRPESTFDAVGYGETMLLAVRAALLSLSVQCDRESRRARRASADLLADLVELDAGKVVA